MSKAKQVPEIEVYNVHPSFWVKKGDRLTVIGDHLGRLPAVDLLNASSGEIILDAGCGAGFCTRRIAWAGAKVYGCDRATVMLNAAKELESLNPLGIEYINADIIALPYSDKSFDAVSCIAVLLQDDPNECLSFFKEAWRVLKPGGRLVISTLNEYIFGVNSPNRTNCSSWGKYFPVSNKPITESQQFREEYRDADGEVFHSTIWCHPHQVLIGLMEDVGFEILQTQERYVTHEVLMACNQSGETGYPAFWQALAIKAT